MKIQTGGLPGRPFSHPKDTSSSNLNTEDNYGHYRVDRVARRAATGALTGLTAGLSQDFLMPALVGGGLGAAASATATYRMYSKPTLFHERPRDPELRGIDTTFSLVGGGVVGVARSLVISTATLCCGGTPLAGAIAGALLGAAGL